MRFDTNITKLLPFPLIFCNTISVVENARDRNARRDRHFDDWYGERNRELTWNPWGMQRDAEHTGEAENKWGPLGGTKGIYVQHLGKSQGNSRGNPPFNGRAIKWENLERIYRASG